MNNSQRQPPMETGQTANYQAKSGRRESNERASDRYMSVHLLSAGVEVCIIHAVLCSSSTLAKASVSLDTRFRRSVYA